MAGDNKPALVALRRRRDEVIEALSNHFANDALTIEEFEDRLEVAHQATALEQLDTLLVDLEVEPKVEATALVVADKPAPPSVPAVEAKRITSILSNVTREGEWRVPKRVRVLSVLGEANIDFRDVHLAPGITEVNAKSILGNIKIIVPPTLAVECEGSAFLGEIVEMNRAPKDPDPDSPRLVISARAILGELKVETRLPGESARQAKRRRKRKLKAEKQRQLTDGSER